MLRDVNIYIVFRVPTGVKAHKRINWLKLLKSIQKIGRFLAIFCLRNENAKIRDSPISPKELHGRQLGTQASLFPTIIMGNQR